ncbi:MAG: YegS/Rv2252/BmrU family lipid kinase [Cyanobacteria bacterium NC_groundwater_1444_Ag_S-0.65um_54_12]|nr:YegS/Rv2252/BmrU family lipid kinase [Cyanobacteria bacterium NC_groundwater_1444_Ag_S-0.65um_54_12]
MERKIRIIINPAARRGNQADLSAQLRAEFMGYQLDIRIPRTVAETIAAASTAPGDGITDLVIVGGDGTINIAVNAIAGTDVRLGLIPYGTANDLANYLGIPEQLPGACETVRRAATRLLDLVEVNGKLFITAGGLGVVSQVAVAVNRFKASTGTARAICRALGSLIYTLYSFIVLLTGRKIYTTVNISCDGHSIGRFTSVAVFVNNQPTIGKTIMPCPAARSDDGELTGLLLERRSRLGTIWTVILMTLRGAHTRRRDAIDFAGKQITVCSEAPATFIGDGEVLACTRNLRLAVRPCAIRVIA